ncbi:DNA topoisomerase IV [Patiriisocius hiemis]|uniref:DNA topoisomerase IV n=1 Tax=Patiriisocius hiemis TaxID=3075604 RepID=A0ABU2YAX5_9FLAO|nr:DNA topoisomerase IV [Constantimarinum sp. W242]MDT0554897.1 DNA topoisomerase IV [Constantimarinum sp. W242]
MRFFLIASLLLLLVSCYSVERDCSSFKTGTFEFEAVIGTEIFKTKFTRNDSIEIDYFRGKADTSSIRWINDCEYIVKNLNPKNMAEEKAIHMKILSTQNDSYTFEYNIVGEEKKQKGTAIKISE